jgi:transcriptional regulator with XRE-family HTH domain
MSDDGHRVGRELSDLIKAECTRQKLSQRALADRVGYGKSTINRMLTGQSLPSPDQARFVLEALGLPEYERERWADRVAGAGPVTEQAPRSPAPPSGPAASGLIPDPSDTDAPEPRTEPPAGRPATSGSDEATGGERTGRGSRRWWSAAVAAITVLVVAGGAVWWWPSRSVEAAPERTIVVQNKVAFGPSSLVEDGSPSYLAARPITRCANVPGCKLPGTDMGSGDTARATCQLQGVTLTNADVRSPGVEGNPNAAASALWYGISWRDGRRGYLSEVYVAPMYRGGLQLPPC